MTVAHRDPKMIFLDALDCEAPGEIGRFLDAACGDDDLLRARVDALLCAHRQAGRFLGGASLLDATLVDPGQNGPPLGAAIGPYKLREVLGEGGMGIVYAAEQERPIRRKVALKVVKPGMDSREVIVRFEAERQALALMDHPHIARVLDAGTTESGRPYFVMELVRGLPITNYCDQAQLSLRERLQLFITVCQAVQHAHQKGIIHRDLKPSNVMITLHDGTPVPKVIDFGVAKALNQRLTDQTVYTRVAQMLGTPMYMSPEQAELSGLDVDTRSDVYSLGVLLYELLTGQTPFDKETFSRLGYDELRRMIRDVEPSRPSARISTLDAARQSTLAQQRGLDPRQLGQTLQGELDWIIIKALEKDRGRRYQSAAALAADVERYLADEPVAACPPSFVYRLTKFVRRHTAALAATVVILVTLIAATALSVWMAIDATNARRSADQRLLAEQQALDRMQRALREKSDALEREAATNQRVYPLDVESAFEILQNKNPALARDVLSLHLPVDGGHDRRGFEWRYLWARSHSSGKLLKGHAETVFSLSFSPDGRRLASSGGDEIARVWDTDTARLRHELVGHTDDVNCIEFSPVGELLATASDDTTLGLWNPETGERLETLRGHTDMVHRVRFSPDGQMLASASTDGEIKSWDLKSGQVVSSVKGHGDRIRAMAISSDGRRLATGSSSDDPVAKLWRFPSLELLATLPVPDDVEAAVFRPVTGELVTCSRGGGVRFWNGQTGAKLRELDTGLYVFGLAFSPDGRTLAIATGAGSPLVLWDADELVIRASYSQGEPGSSWCVAYSPNGSCIATGNHHDVALIRHADRPNHQRVARLELGIHCLARPSDGQTITVGCPDGTLRRFDLPTGDELSRKQVHSGGVACAEYSPDGALLATGGVDQSVNVWNAATHRTVQSLTGFAREITDVAFSIDGRRLAACDGQLVKIWDTSTWQVLDERPVPSGDRLVFSNTGGVLVAGGQMHYLMSDSTPVAIQMDAPVLAMDVSDDGRLVALGHDALNPSLFDLGSYHTAGVDRVTPLSSLRSNRILAVAMTHDSKTLAAVDSRGWTAFWNIATGTKMLTLNIAELTGLPDDFQQACLAFTPDDTALIFCMTPVPGEPETPRQSVVFALHAPRIAAATMQSTTEDDNLTDSDDIHDRFLNRRGASSRE